MWPRNIWQKLIPVDNTGKDCAFVSTCAMWHGHAVFATEHIRCPFKNTSSNVINGRKEKEKPVTWWKIWTIKAALADVPNLN